MSSPAEILARIDLRLKELQLTDNKASLLARKPDSIRNLRRAVKDGTRTGVTTSTMTALAPVLRTSVGWLLEGTGEVNVEAGDNEIHPANESLIPVKVAGKVEAGAFRSQEDLGDWDEAETFLEVRDSRFPHARHLGFAVEGDSMNALKPRPILPGDRLMALAFEDIGDRMPLRDGMVVVVERSRFDGMEREWSVKQIELYEDRIEFHPRSTNPRHRKIVVPRDGAADDGIKVEIIAVVRRVSNEFPF
jgi:hypothetical protein